MRIGAEEMLSGRWKCDGREKVPRKEASNGGAAGLL